MFLAETLWRWGARCWLLSLFLMVGLFVVDVLVLSIWPKIAWH